MKTSGKKSGKQRPPKKDRKAKPHRHERKSKYGGHPRGDRTAGAQAHGMPEIGVLVITGESEEGDLIAAPAKWDSKHQPPHIIITESSKQPAASKGDRVLAKLQKIKPQLFQATIIRVLEKEPPLQVLGVFLPTAEGGIIEPISRKMKESFMVAREDTHGAVNGELVSGVTLPGVPSLGMTYAKITERLGRLDAPRVASLIASHMHHLPQLFSKEAMKAAENAEAPSLPSPASGRGEERIDLRDIPLVTIDGADARDFDDAVFAEKDGDGWHIVVAIADVAYYVKEGSALDAEAFERGNSVYFPDRVIPMLPERLSNGLCSLNPDEDRYCLAVHITIDAMGNVRNYKFVRGLMRSRARLTYEQVEASSLRGAQRRGNPENKDWIASPSARNDEIEIIITNLYSAYAALAHERDHRGSLDLNLPEFKIQFDDQGNVANIAPRARLESHRLIEAYMIAANVCAADFLLKHKAPGIYRVHEAPDETKLEELKNLLQMAGYSLHTGAGVKAAHFNRVLKQVEGKPEAYLINTAILRSQMQAFYSPQCLGHFGLSLQKYCHFTSPIRRYADLVVHRSLAHLISHSPATSKKNLDDIAQHISDTERRAMLAERDASDRYKVAYMARHVGNNFAGTIVSLNEYGLFVSLSDNGVTGFIPVRNLSAPGGQGDFFRYDKRHACFKGQRTHTMYQIGQPLMIRVQSANSITSSLIFEICGTPTPPDMPLRQKHKREKHRK